MPKITVVHKNGLAHQITTYSKLEKVVLWVKKKLRKGTNEPTNKRRG